MTGSSMQLAHTKICLQLSKFNFDKSIGKNKEWTGLSVSESPRVSKDQKRWRDVIRRSMMTTLRPPEVMG